MKLALPVLVCALVASACAGAAQEAEPFVGRWQSEGFGSYLVIAGGDADVYEHTSVSCGKVLEGTAEGISEVASLVDGRLVIDDGGRLIRYDAVDALPPECADPYASEDPRRTFDVLVATFSEHYASLEGRDPDWEGRHPEIAAPLSPQSSSQELFGAVAELLGPLGDPQLRVIFDEDGIVPEGRVWSPTEMPPVVLRLRESIRSGTGTSGTEIVDEGTVVTGRLSGGAGYVAITSFAGLDEDTEDAEEELAETLDRFLADVTDAPGLVIDLRANPGGFRDQAMLVASRFVPSERAVFRYEARVGGTDRYVDAGTITVRPMPTGVYSAPIVLLTGPGTIGAAELLVLALRDLPNVTVLGEPTAGSAAPLLARVMPNGWSVGLSNTRIVDAGGRHWDVVGIPPDLTVGVTIEDLDAGVDPVVARAEGLLAGS